MLFSFNAVVTANKIVAELDKRNTNVYVTLAKIALWVVAVELVSVMVGALGNIRFAEGVEWATYANVIVNSCHGLMALALAVLGLHHYTGSRILHILRNWNNEKDSPQ